MRLLCTLSTSRNNGKNLDEIEFLGHLLSHHSWLATCFTCSNIVILFIFLLFTWQEHWLYLFVCKMSRYAVDDARSRCKGSCSLSTDDWLQLGVSGVPLQVRWRQVHLWVERLFPGHRIQSGYKLDNRSDESTRARHMQASLPYIY